MPEPTLQSRVSSMRTTLQTIEAQLVRGDVGGDGLADLKAGVDDLRLRIWAVMAAANSGDPGALERFRIRRAIDVCNGLADELAAGTIDPAHRELEQLRDAARKLAES